MHAVSSSGDNIGSGNRRRLGAMAQPSSEIDERRVGVRRLLDLHPA